MNSEDKLWEAAMEDEKKYGEAYQKALDTWLKVGNIVHWTNLDGVINDEYEVSEIWEPEPDAGILSGGISITKYDINTDEEVDTLWLQENWNGEELKFLVYGYNLMIVGEVNE